MSTGAKAAPLEPNPSRQVIRHQVRKIVKQQIAAAKAQMIAGRRNKKVKTDV